MDKVIKKILSSMVIIIDSREKLPSYISNTFDKYKIKYIIKKCNSGDYESYIPKSDLIEDDIYSTIAIERKMNIEEIIGNLTTNRERFKREFKRKDKDVIIMIEKGTYKDIVEKKYKNKVEPNSVLASLHSISDEFGLNFIFIDKEVAPLFIYKTMYYNLRNILKNNSNKLLNY